MAVHSTQAGIVTDVFDWGSIKWGVTPQLFPGAPLTVGEVVINPTMGHAPHTHPESDEVLYIMEGEGVQTVGDSGEFPVGPGDSIFIPMGTLHSTFNTGWKQLRILAIYCPGGAEAALRTLPDFAQLYAWFNNHFLTRKGASIKDVAPIFGFEWAVVDAGGAQSQVKIDLARTDGVEARAAREWLHHYNESDVAARQQSGTGCDQLVTTRPLTLIDAQG